jgi:drug/metabolite transporter (DMT)-like permease
METYDYAIVMLVLISVQAVFAYWPVAVKIALEDCIGVFELTLLRDIMASVMLLAAAYTEDFYYGAFPTHINTNMGAVTSYFRDLIDDVQKDLRIFTILGVCSFVNSCGYVFALQFVTPFMSALFHPAIPVFAGVLGVYAGVQQMSMTKMIGLAVCITGSIFVVLAQHNGDIGTDGISAALLFGNFLLILQSFAMAALLVCQKIVPNQYSSLKTTAIYYSIGTCLSIPISIIVTSVSSEGWLGLGVNVIFVILFGALFVIGFNYAALTWVNKILSPAVPAASMMLQPPLAYLASTIFLPGTNTSPATWQMVGGAAIVLGLVITLCETPLDNNMSDPHGGTMSALDTAHSPMMVKVSDENSGLLNLDRAKGLII